MIVVPFERDHLNVLNLQKAQRDALSLLTEDVINEIEKGQSITVIVDDNAMVCCGIHTDGMGRGILWALVSQDIGKHILQITKLFIRFFNMANYRRLETVVDCDFEAGHRWMKIMGFEMEAERMKSYYPNGKDCSLYARVR